MIAKKFEQYNTFLGWFCFTIALTVYSCTVEPTGSFWDAGELIATSAKLQVAHPPGAPLFQMIGAFASLFALQPDQVAICVNYVSVVASAFTILFMFWTITNLVQKLNRKSIQTSTTALAILGSGFTGAMAFTFSDSFWFNATETEVYATANFVMTLLLWLGLKWVDHINDPYGNRWLVLISFVIGLTFGIQFMGFLAIPTIGLLFYFKNYETTFKNFVTAHILAVGTLLVIYKFSLSYVLKAFGKGEVFLVNVMGLPFNAGSLIIALLFVVIFYLALRYTRKKKYVVANTVVLCVLFIFLGFSSWIMLPLRASAQVVVNENNPEDARSLLAYYNREQYPSVDSPFYGTYYSDMFASAGKEKDEKPKYEKDLEQGKYIIVNAYKDALQGPNTNHVGLLPRMWSTQHAANYMRYYGVLDFEIRPEYRSTSELTTPINRFKTAYAKGKVDVEGYIQFLKDFASYINVNPPTVMQQLKFMFHFQFAYMYGRYFMWNFVGRQNDKQGRFDGNGNWISGITAIDSLRLGSQYNLPDSIKNSKGRNTYYFLPLLLGIVGLIFQARRDWKQFWPLLVFFVFTGLAIQFYTNPYIFQPRERDYSLVGSFYVFGIWIGIGVYALFIMLKKWLNPKLSTPFLMLSCMMLVPGLMSFENWDDHDRSHRYTTRSTAKAYLDSCQENAGAILYSIGDNDTFPLWYAQEIEAYRTDVRVIATTYFVTDWYIDQMKRKAYESDPIPSQLTHNQYRYGTRDAVYYQNLTDQRWDIQDFMNWIGSDKPETKFRYLLERQGADLSKYPESTLDIVYYPTYKIRIPVNKKNVLKNGLVNEKDKEFIVDYIDIDLPQTALAKNRILMLDVLANNHWERPIYFSGGSFDDEDYLWLKDYLQLDGLVYKLVPIKTAKENTFELGRIDADLMFTIVKKWQWGNSGSDKIYHDPQTRKQGISFRVNLARLVESLLAENKIEKARETIEIAMQNLPIKHFEYYAFVEPFIDGYYKVGEPEKARALYLELKALYQDRLQYYAAMPRAEQYNYIEAIITDMQAYRRNVDILAQNGDIAWAEKETLIFNTAIDQFQHFMEDAMQPEPIKAPLNDNDLLR